MPSLPKTQRRPWMTERKAFERNRQGQFDYGSIQWKKLRRVFIMSNPLCAECMKHNRVRNGTVVDHITSIKQGGEPYDWSNLQTLCKQCHDTKSAKEAHT